MVSFQERRQTLRVASRLRAELKWRSSVSASRFVRYPRIDGLPVVLLA